MKALITQDSWILCGKCGRKLAKRVGIYSNISQAETSLKTAKNGSKIEFKCPCCKEVVIYDLV